MCIGVNPRLGQQGGAEVPWTCPRGHGQSDDAPLPQRLFCSDCDGERRNPFYERDEVTVAAGGGREVAYA